MIYGGILILMFIYYSCFVSIWKKNESGKTQTKQQRKNKLYSIKNLSHIIRDTTENAAKSYS